MNVDGKVAVVTGASRGVGRATAIDLAKGGCAVVVNYSSSEGEAAEVVGEIASDGGTAMAVQGNVAEDAACRRLIDEAVRAYGGLDILVNNAGTSKFINHDKLEEVDDALWERIMDVNVKGPFQCMRAARKHLEAGDGGEVVNVTSVAGVSGMGSCIPYCCSKAAMINMTLSMARVLGPTVRVNAVGPGFIEGVWLERGLGAQYDKVKGAVEDVAVLNKVCRPEDVAAAIVSLITGSDLVTGQNVICDGGMLAGKWA
jgi:3-oxoacyl-[acyl-carrier protein] reductase